MEWLVSLLFLYLLNLVWSVGVSDMLSVTEEAIIVFGEAFEWQVCVEVAFSVSL